MLDVVAVPGGQGRRWPVEPLRIEIGHGLRQDLVEDRLIGRPHLVALRLGVVLLPAPAAVGHIVFPGAVDLVIAAPQGQARVVAQAADIVIGLGADIFEQRRIVGVHRAGEGEFLPDEDAVSVAEVIEAVVLVDAAAPHSDHVHMGVDGRLDDALIDLFRHPWQEAVIGNIVGALHEDRHAIELDIEAGTVGIGRLHDTQCAQAYPDLARLCGRTGRQSAGQGVEMRFAEAVRPPQVRLGDGQRQLNRVKSGLQRHRLLGGYAIGALDIDHGRAVCARDDLEPGGQFRFVGRQAVLDDMQVDDPRAAPGA